MLDFCKTNLAYLVTLFIFIKAIEKKLPEISGSKNADANFKVTWGLYWVMICSSCRLIRPLQEYKVSPLFVCIFPLNFWSPCVSDSVFSGLKVTCSTYSMRSVNAHTRYCIRGFMVQIPMAYEKIRQMLLRCWARKVNNRVVFFLLLYSMCNYCI